MCQSLRKGNHLAKNTVDNTLQLSFFRKAGTTVIKHKGVFSTYDTR